MAAATALFIFCKKRWSYVGFFGVLLMAFSRVYLIAHYATDVIAGMISGAIAGTIAWLITLAIFRLLNRFREKKFCKFCLYADVRDPFHRKTKKEEDSQS